ncbi:glycosyltransferase family 4 protein [Caldovatus sediminis]|uniref:glycosyltransferase family 4 protein n=1 Tax=Caldovatus sediminis TaxID=2041189 RepID=UPI001E40176A|nr:glycosyltransferase family 1 protein [Caldovatus sediminis]
MGPPPASHCQPVHVLLDVSRLLSCGRRQTPSGIDRVEAAYARYWLAAAPPERVGFVGLSGWGDFAAVPRQTVQAMLGALDEAWAGVGPGLGRARKRAARIGAAAQSALLAGLGRGALRRLLRSAGGRRSVLLSVSHRSLERREPILRLRQQGAAFVPLVHDLIPATHPEYARPGDAGRHLQRLATVAALADGVIVNSEATEAVLRPHLIRRGGPPPVAVAPLGLELPPAALGAALATSPQGPEARREAPYFVTIGTIEPRKNHLLLLHVWRDFAARLGPDAPRLLLIGRRGWENENVLDLLDRCTALRGLVEEVGQVTDLAAMRLLRGARALLFPSFAEGYGLPLAEALALGTPALVSDIPALREVGGAAPDYLDPLDGPGWARAILDYADPRSAARAAQQDRLRQWRAPSWADHFAIVQDLLARIVAAPDGALAAAGRGGEPARSGGGRLRPAAPATPPAAAVVAAADGGVR